MLVGRISVPEANLPTYRDPKVWCLSGLQLDRVVVGGRADADEGICPRVALARRQLTNSPIDRKTWVQGQVCRGAAILTAEDPISAALTGPAHLRSRLEWLLFSNCKTC
jgi:hypothetical protein